MSDPLSVTGNLISRSNRTVGSARSGDRTRSRESPSSVQESLGAGFEQVLQSVEKANGHVQTARSLIYGPGQRRASSGDSAAGSGAASSERRVDFRA